MKMDMKNRGGAPVGALGHMESWEIALVVNLRHWCDGPSSRAEVFETLASVMPREIAAREVHAFGNLIELIVSHSHRPLVCHDLACACIGADEGIFVHLVRTASGGDLGEASLIATLLASAAHAEHIALLAAQVGCNFRRMSAPTGSGTISRSESGAHVH